MEKTKDQKEYTANRHPTKDKDGFSSYSLSSISLGNTERRVLSNLPKDTTTRFNTKNFARETGIPRTTISDVLNRLQKKGLCEKVHWGIYIITDQGKKILQMTEGGVGKSRKGWREGAKISQHFSRFVLPINFPKDFKTDLFKQLMPDRIKTLEIPNNLHHYLYFNDATIIIFKKQVIIRVHDLLDETAEETLLSSFNRALELRNKLEGIGLKSDVIKLEQAHWARVESHFAEFLKKINDKFYLDLGNGRMLWVDFSTGKIEHETNNLEVEKRLSEFLDDAIKSESLISDLDKMKGVTGNLVKISALHTKNFVQLNSIFSKGMGVNEFSEPPKEQKKLTSYIG